MASSVPCKYFPIGSCWRHILELSYSLLYCSMESTRSVIGYGPQGKEFLVSWGSGISRVKWPSLSVIITSCPIHFRLLSNGPVHVNIIVVKKVIPQKW